MSILYQANGSVRELTPNEVYVFLQDTDFYKVEGGRRRFEASGNKIKNQVGELLRLEKVVIKPIK